MADPKPTKADAAKADPKPRGPVKYLAMAELSPGRWAIMGEPGREASSVYTLRKELRAELDAAAEATGAPTGDVNDLIIIPLDQAHIVRAAREMEVRETFTKTTLKAGPDIATLMVPVESEADVAARMAAGPVPDGAVVPPDSPPDPVAEAAHRAAMAAEAAARAAMPADPEAELPPDVDPDTLLSRRTADQAVPEDEGRTVFPMDER